jgi:glutamate synthase (NADPH/NADH) small chain
MGKIGGFKEYDRTESNIVITERVSNYNEFTIPLAKDKIKEQGSRCMDCGILFCHSACPLEI